MTGRPWTDDTGREKRLVGSVEAVTIDSAYRADLRRRALIAMERGRAERGETDAHLQRGHVDPTAQIRRALGQAKS